MEKSGWVSGPVLAWTDSEGPQRPPDGGGRLVPGALAGTLGVVFLGMLGTDVLCPEHRALVQGFATLAIVGIVVAIVGLLRGWALAPFTTLASALAGVAIGVIDTAHDPSRGRIVAVAFGVVAAGAAFLAVRQVALARWDRAVGAEVAPLPADGTLLPPPATDPATGPEVAAEAPEVLSRR
jgi:hypothetical protein